MSSFQLEVIVDLPAHSLLAQPLSYLSPVDLTIGTLVCVPLGKKTVLGIVWQCHALEEGLAWQTKTTVQDAKAIPPLKPIEHVLGFLPPLSADWLALARFTAQYYQRSLGEVALQALPPELRKITPVQLERKLKKLQKEIILTKEQTKDAAQESHAGLPQLTTEQQHAIDTIKSSFNSSQARVFLLQGATGSGKTEVYMRLAQEVLAQNPNTQVLVLVPEINLTPQLEERFKERFPQIPIVCQHSRLTPAQRLQGWLKAHTGYARIILGTRMAIFASIPHLELIVVDEEHDPSYKQYEGARWSARDLAIWRGWNEKISVLFGSATPSIESWLHAQKKQYQLLEMPARIGGGAMPNVRIVDMQREPRYTLIARPLINAIEQRLANKEQTLLLLNRRGYAPVLCCPSCGWQSQCPYCSAWRVFHRIDRSLRCHHCGFTQPVPRACPQCGELDLRPIGQGTEKLEEQLQTLFTHPDGTPAQVVRIDADSTRQAGSLVMQLEKMHSGQADILVGTQMIAKGHDFRRVTLVAAINPDNALFSTDFRASERLFSMLFQAAGRAGRDATLATHSELWIQTSQPAHPLFKTLKTYDYAAFAQDTLEERQIAAMPPYVFQALLRTDAKTQEAAQDFLKQAQQHGQAILEAQQLSDRVIIYPPIPATMQRIANIERAQMLIESPSRQALQKFLTALNQVLHQIHQKGLIRWAVDVDPLSI